MPSTLAWIVDGRAFVAGSTMPDGFSTVLSAHERARLQRFLKPQRAREFLLGRLLMRYALMHATGCSLDAIAVTERPGASPLVAIGGRLADGVQLPAASISHSRGWIACALGKLCQVGVDIEVPAPQRDLAALAELAFTTGERSWLAAQTWPEQAFYQLWCGKEALYKYCSNAGLDETTTHHLHHHHSDAYHLCICSPVAPQQHHHQQLELADLLKLSSS
ncbi:4'-phosphopantetheinyl transferase family protein [Herbaspirillum sp. NPDC087042]|uniref:4'-phosphopantetheinyl transferase family protein n=1 Tax=Herbaspirillum sp. NPDC087042 TaxID=3364004 RepID=UPI0037FCF4C4